MPILECQAISSTSAPFTRSMMSRSRSSAGEVVDLMGDNGAGKSTLVRIVAGNFPPTAGKLFVDGPPSPLRAAVRGPRGRSRDPLSRSGALRQPAGLIDIFMGRELATLDQAAAGARLSRR